MWIPASNPSTRHLLTTSVTVAVLAVLPQLSFAETVAAEDHGQGAHVEEQDNHQEGGHQVQGGHQQDSHGAQGGHQVQHLDNWFSLSFGPDKEHKNGPLAFAILNFVILLWLLVRFAKKPFRDFLIQRSSTISKDLKDAAELNQQARKKLSQIEAKLGSLSQEIEEIKDSVAQDAQLEKERIIKNAEAEADRIIKQADKTLESELRRARRRLEVEAVGAALAAAEKLIKQKVDATDHKRLNEEYFSQINSSGGTN